MKTMKRTPIKFQFILVCIRQKTALEKTAKCQEAAPFLLPQADRVWPHDLS